MPKYVLEFTMPEDKEEFHHAVKGIRYAIAIEEFDNFLRQKIKYTEEKPKSYEEIRNEFNQILENNDID